VIVALLLAATIAVPAEAPPAKNRLAGEPSRYLQQHATNPVDWYPWGDAAFEKARRENKPVFLSIGYSTCHWCRVMEEESFADAEVARLMNEAFVAVKVDREERPDLDAVYLTVARTLTGDAGWPNNVILTPDGKPFFAAAYIPRAKFVALIPRIREMWATQRDTVVANAEMVTRSLSSTAGESAEAADADVLLRRGFEQLAARFDAEHGGFLPAPKFPAPHQLMFLMRYWERTGERRALEMAETTLLAMRRGGLWDATELGFHRYASDAQWREPHYEKMLYDQALLALAYLEAWQATRKEIYAQTAREIFTFVMRDLQAPDGAFYAALDADERYYTARDRKGLARPGRDEKVIADWNGLMIAALSRGASVLDEPKYARAAERAATSRRIVLRPYLDDHAFMVWGLLELYEATFDVAHLERAMALSDETNRRFGTADGRFYITPGDGPALLVRPREAADGAMPSGNSVQLMNLVRIARITGDARYEGLAAKMQRATFEEIDIAPSTAAWFLSAIAFASGKSFEVVISGDATRAMRRAVFGRFVPNKVVLHRPAQGGRIESIAPYVIRQKPLRGRTTVYVCTDRLCRMPVTRPEQVWSPAN
jgi:uncharacterized protein YyaL (SSP411 family)